VGCQQSTYKLNQPAVHEPEELGPKLLLHLICNKIHSKKRFLYFIFKNDLTPKKTSSGSELASEKKKYFPRIVSPG